jgi:DNA adenine methylase
VAPDDDGGLDYAALLVVGDSMNYLGGKSRIAKRLAAAITARNSGPFWDPFCGGLAMSAGLPSVALASDVHPALIAMYQAIAEGWRPPEHVTAAEYAAARALPDSDPFKAFAGFACSFGGKYFAGYSSAREPHTIRSGPKQGQIVHPTNRAAVASRTLIQQVTAFTAQGGQFQCVDWLAEEPRPYNGALYLDPPYRAARTHYSQGAFNFGLFDHRCIAWSAYCDVFISEYTLPYGERILEIPALRNGLAKPERIESLYYIARGSIVL